MVPERYRNLYGVDKKNHHEQELLAEAGSNRGQGRELSCGADFMGQVGEMAGTRHDTLELLSRCLPGSIC